MSVPLSFSALFISNLFVSVFSIDCFKCMSINKDYQPCEDPFHHNYTVDVFQSPCMTGRKGRDGAFPATSCVKINGVFGYSSSNSPNIPFSNPGTKEFAATALHQPNRANKRITIGSFATQLCNNHWSFEPRLVNISPDWFELFN